MTRPLVALVGLALAALGAVGPIVPPSAAAPAETPGQVLVESVTPAAPAQDSTITISGRVANSSESAMSDPVVQLRLSPLPLNSRGEIPQVFNGTSARDGNAIPGAIQAVATSLAPGQQAEFSIAVPVSDLGLPATAAGVYAVFVEFLADGVTVGTAGTMFPWFPKKAVYRSSGLALMWPIIQQPAVAAHELVTDPAIPVDLTPTGRLNRLLTIGQEHNVSWLVDAATLEAASGMADGYLVEGPDGPEPGDETAAAEAFSDQLRQVLTTNKHTTMPQYALADDDALQRGLLTPFVVRSATLPTVTEKELTHSANSTVAYVAPEGGSDSATLQILVDAGVRQFVMSDQFFPPVPVTSYTPSGVTSTTVGGTPVQVLLIDHQLGNSLAGPFDTAAERSRAHQEFLSDTAMITLERPAEPRRVIAAPPWQWDPPESWLRSFMADLSAAPWIRLIGLDHVGGATPVPREEKGYGQLAQSRELPPSYVQRIGGLDEELDSMSRIVNDPAGFGESFTLGLQRAASALWRKSARSRNKFLDTIDAQLAEEKNRVRVVSSGTVTLAGDNGIVPLTIANDLDRPVTVGLQLRTENPIRLQYTPPDPVRIDAQEKTGIEVPVRVVGSQPMDVSVIITDRDGFEYDNSATIQLRSTAATRIATIVVGVGSVALVILVVLNLVRRRRNAVGSPDPDTESPDRQDENV